MNTTPLIDVLLVLLVMILLSIPLATQTLEVDLPGPAAKPADAPQVSIAIAADGTVSWNGQTVDAPRLDNLLAQAAATSPAPVIRFEPDANASYDASVKVIAQVRDAGITRFAFIGNERYRTFTRD